ncbi:hypothetical protein [Streptosporangium sp. NPDC000396]|uniref:hypothetical protein n=1 Tax=Streptosporangium sp. NPDC000396 TaxID=3366185 RepID=UPI00369CFD5C
MLQEVVLAQEADQYTESLNQLVLADLIDTYAYDRHIHATRLRYGRRRTLLLERLAHDPGSHRARRPRGAAHSRHHLGHRPV